MKINLLERFTDGSAANQMCKHLIRPERAKLATPEKVQDSTFSATC
jgi:hypothetical protein